MLILQRIETCHRVRGEEDIYSQKIKKSHKISGRRKCVFTEDREMLQDKGREKEGTKLWNWYYAAEW